MICFALALGYLEGTKGYGLVYRRQPRDDEFGCCAERVPDYQLDPQYLPKGVNRTSDCSLHIYAHIDSDHARDLDTRRSVTAFAIIGNGTSLVSLEVEDATYISEL